MNEYWYREPGDTMTSIEVALVFGVDVRSVRRWAREGKLPYFETPGGRRRFRRQDIEKIAAKGRRTAERQAHEAQGARDVPR